MKRRSAIVMEATEHGFVVAAEDRSGCLFYRSFHRTVEIANQYLRRTIDADKLRVVEAIVIFGNSGNVRRWLIVKTAN